MFVQAACLAAFLLGVNAQSSSTSSVSAQTTTSLFLPPQATGYGYDATVLHADACATTVGLYCTSGSEDGAVAYCLPPYTVYVTYLGTTSFIASTQTVIGGGHGTFIEGCQIDGTARAVCSTTIRVSGNHDKVLVQTATTTLTGNQVHFSQVPITAGAAKLRGFSTATSSCAAALTATSAGAAAATGVARQAMKALGVPGAAALLVGAIM